MKFANCMLAVMLVIGQFLSAPAYAQTYPTKPIRIIVPYAPGGTTDILARTVGQKLQEKWGQPVIVDNRPGANGIIGTEMVAKAPADGYTLGIASPGTHAINASLYPKLQYDTVKDFTPVTLAVMAPFLFVVHPSVPANSIKELIAYAKSKPGQLSYASGGSGSSQHLAMEQFKSMAGLDITHVSYKGSAASYTDLLGGQVQMEIDVLPTAMPHVKTGKLRALATGSAKRLPLLPDLPTIAESGLPGYESTSWYGFVAPANLPKNILTQLNTEITRILNAPDVREKLEKAGLVVVASTPEEFAAHIKSEMAKDAKIVREANIKAD
jgi:tripartite-type tricarboxylate transporter receptor subunit TctC